MAIEVAGLTGCCGGLVLAHSNLQPGYATWTPSGYKPKAAPKDHESQIRQEMKQHASKGLVIYTTIRSQKGPIEALKKIGFTRVSEWYNPNTRHRVTLWYYLINQPKPRVRKRATKKGANNAQVIEPAN